MEILIDMITLKDGGQNTFIEFQEKKHRILKRPQINFIIQNEILLLSQGYCKTENKKNIRC